ncbi:MAG: protein jag [Thermodesulfobacteriota bacterium]
MEEAVEIGKRLLTGLVEGLGVRPTIEGFIKEGNLYFDLRGDKKGILIGKYGRTLDALQMLINRMIQKELKRPLRVILDVDGYRKRRVDTLSKMALRLGEKAKRLGHSLTIGPFNAHDRRIIHMALREDPSLRTESIGEGDTKKITIIPKR